ncbi:hypothetical protein B7755_038845 [Streptomyces sp. NBS 14/10]|uniref:hypothetical protein n=1 Tax=Streptomyces sp. NBS 14/10 TaxID=1945643 RepID=UPI0015C64C88|nr:hypothetical protein [Streptomyces sp. NBS 14/10]KAK1183566.1 hypothetical protein B7755_038845 [Streptomyces sp. NBS 14/10]
MRTARAAPVGGLEHVQEVEDAPPAYDLVLTRLKAGELVQLLQLRHGDPRLAVPGVHLAPARRSVHERG